MTKEELKNLKKGTIVYYITDRFRKCYADPTAWSVEFGVFDELSSYRISKDNVMINQSEGIVLTLERKDCRWVKTLTSDWTPFDKFKSETEMHKLPKKWSYDTDLFWIENRYPQDCFNFDIRNRKKIKQLYDEGWFVELDKNDHRKQKNKILINGLLPTEKKQKSLRRLKLTVGKSLKKNMKSLLITLNSIQ
jgi:hypothetical protein